MSKIKPEPLPDNYIDPGHNDHDRELLEIFYTACQSEGGTADEIHLRGIRAVLAANPTPHPPADGEVAELVAELRHFVAEYQQVRGLDPENIYSIQQGDLEKEAHLCISRLTRVADLLDHPQPVAHVDVGIEWMPCAKLPTTVHVRDQRPGETHSITRNGITPLRFDDLIMRGIQGEEYPIGRELFEQTYKLLSTPETTNG